jgi:hypothetical protein
MPTLEKRPAPTNPDNMDNKKAKTADEDDAMSVDSLASRTSLPTLPAGDRPAEMVDDDVANETQTPHSNPTEYTNQTAAVTQSPPSANLPPSDKDGLQAKLDHVGQIYRQIYHNNANPCMDHEDLHNSLSRFSDKSNATMAENFFGMFHCRRQSDKTQVHLHFVTCVAR